MAEFFIDGRSLSIEQVVKIADNPNILVKIAPEAVANIQRAADAVQQFIQQGRIAYGITTGFGAFKDRLISADQAEKLQENIVLSHAVGVGPHLDDRTVRAMILIRANTLAKGHSGIRLKTIELLLSLLNNNILPVIPSKGSLGASGDLAPLAHMSLPLLGFGQVKINGHVVNLSEALEKFGLEPIHLAAKEGLALTNGTSMMTAIAALSIDAAEALISSADCAGALSLEAQNGTLRAFMPQIHQSRPQKYQSKTAEHIRALLQDSHLTRPDSSLNVQDVYSLRCIPQVHGAVRNALDYARSVVEIELNSATDNPLLFFEENKQVEIISGGNFHGEPLALALDFLAIALADLGNMSERRIAKLIDKNTEYYPSFLAADGGLNSGFMLLQYTAAALASENKSLAHPSSLDSISSSGNVEDHVSMGANAALHCVQVLENVNTIVAIELMSAAQAIDFRLQKSPELKLGSGTVVAMRKIREILPFYDHDEFLQPMMQKMINAVSSKTFAFL